MGHWWASVIAGSRGSRIICPTAPQLAMEINWKSGKVADVGVSLGVMNCVRRLANVLVAAMTITGLLVIMSGFACAHVASTAAARQTKNYALFFALVAKMAPEGRLPRLSDPSARDVLNRFWDVSLLGQAPYTGDDLKSLSAIANLQSSVIKKYATFKGVPEQQPANDARYQDELSHGARMSITAVAAILNGLAAFVAPEIESGSLSREYRTGVAPHARWYGEELSGRHQNGFGRCHDSGRPAYCSGGHGGGRDEQRRSIDGGRSAEGHIGGRAGSG